MDAKHIREGIKILRVLQALENHFTVSAKNFFYLTDVQDGETGTSSMYDDLKLWSFIDILNIDFVHNLDWIYNQWLHPNATPKKHHKTST